MKKIFGGIDLTWKKLILSAIVAGTYTALVAIIPITKDTSFRDIAIQLEWWILFGIIIICNSKTFVDSALKCFVFFLISQPLVYLLQVPFSSAGWKIFGYYKYWFLWTLFTIPMGAVGYYIKKKNLLSLIILLPMLLILALLGLGYFTAAIENIPHHLLSCIFCFAVIIVVIMNLFDKIRLRIVAFGIVILFIVVYTFFRGGLNSEYETIRSLDAYNFSGNLKVSYYSGTKKGKVSLISTENSYNVKINGRNNGKYEFTLTDEVGNDYIFEYYYDKSEKTVVLRKK